MSEPPKVITYKDIVDYKGRSITATITNGVCNCGAKISMTNSGAQRTHIKSKTHDINIQRLEKKKEKKDQTNSYKKWWTTARTKISATVKTTTTSISNNVSAISQNVLSSPLVQKINNNYNKYNNNNHEDDDINMVHGDNDNNIHNKNKQYKTIKHKLAIYDPNSGEVQEIYDLEDTKELSCIGIIPAALQSKMKENDSIFEYMPFDKIKQIQNRNFIISENAIHHHRCCGILVNPVPDRSYNIECGQLINDTKLNNLINTAFNAKGERARHIDMSWNSLKEKLKTLKNKILRQTAVIQYKEILLHNQTTKISFLKRVQNMFAQGNAEEIRRLMDVYRNNGHSDQWLVSQFQLYMNGAYTPQKYSIDDEYKSLLTLCLCGPQMLDIFHNAGILMSKQSTRARFII